MTIKQLMESAQSDQAIEMIRNATAGTEYEGRLYMAGGFVRDELLGRDSKDVDFVVDGGPESGLEAATFIARKLGVYKEGSNPVVFPQYYTAKLTVQTSAGPMDIEFVAPRKEKYQPGSRKPEVASGSLEDDVLRRDFTVNSLLKNLHTGKVLDLSGRGIKDLRAGVLNTTGDADWIFGEDPLRILRAIRFAIKYDFKLPMNVIKSIKKNAHTLHDISTERINDEVSKILVLKKPSKAFELFRITGILKEIMPELQDLVDLKQNAYHSKDAWGHSLDVLDASSPDLIKRLGALFHDIGKAATRTEKNGKIQFIGHAPVGADIARVVLRRLKYPNDVIDRVVNIVKYHMDLKSAGADASQLKDSTLRKFIFRVSHNLEDLLDVMHADNVSHSEAASMPEQIALIRKKIDQMDVNDILNTKSVLDGNEIRELGATGPLIGQIKDRILEKVLENPSFTRDNAVQLAKNMISSSKNKANVK
jgi:putative nucleotidyltransferase with HDIG domain